MWLAKVQVSKGSRPHATPPLPQQQQRQQANSF
jgi:hypothetical protein